MSCERRVRLTFGLIFALDHGLKSLGLPCLSPSSRQPNPFDPTLASSMLEAAFSQKTTRRRYLCPLDLAALSALSSSNRQ